jgi:hypothetical protein
VAWQIFSLLLRAIKVVCENIVYGWFDEKFDGIF